MRAGEMRPTMFALSNFGYRAGNLSRLENPVIVLGVVLLVLGFLFNVSVLTTLGIVLLVIGAVLFLLGSMGHPVAGRRHYY